MALTTGQVNIVATATPIAQSDSDGCAIHIHIPGNTGLYLGASNVTTANGLFLDKGAGVRTFQLNAGDALYGIATSGTVAITYLRID
jgi:hypothetical protein